MVVVELFYAVYDNVYNFGEEELSDKEFVESGEVVIFGVINFAESVIVFFEFDGYPF